MTIIISSHILSELEQVAERYGIIHQGNLVKEVTREELEKETKRYLLLKVENAAEAVTVLEQSLGIKDYEVFPDNELRVYEYLDNAAEVTFQLSSNQIRVNSISEEGSTLEDYFMSITGKKQGEV